MRNTRLVWLQNFVVGSALLTPAAAETAFPLLSNCYDDAEKISEVSAADPLMVRYASAAGGAKPCYAVQVTKAGQSLSGFLLAPSLPAIDRFEADVRAHVPLVPPPPPPAPPKPSPAASLEPEPEPPGPTSLVGLKGSDIYGRFVSLSSIPAPYVVVYFWSASDKKSIRIADDMGTIRDLFDASARRLQIMGVGTAKSVEQLLQVSQESEVVWPQIYDRDHLAARYHVRPERPYLLLDRSRNVIAAVATPKQLESELRRVGLK